jgi:hypothetical protein
MTFHVNALNKLAMLHYITFTLHQRQVACLLTTNHMWPATSRLLLPTSCMLLMTNRPLLATKEHALPTSCQKLNTFNFWQQVAPSTRRPRSCVDAVSTCCCNVQRSLIFVTLPRDHITTTSAQVSEWQ